MTRTVVSCVNKAYSDPLKVWLSVMAEQSSHLNVILYHAGDIDPSDFPTTVDVTWRLLDVPPQKSTRPHRRQGILMRFLAFDDLHARRMTHIVYMDLDALPFGNLTPLLNTPVRASSPIAAVPDLVFLGSKQYDTYYDRSRPEIVHRLNLNLRYFNAGVMAIYLPGLYARLNGKTLYGYWEENKHRYLFHGQDPLNELVPDYTPLPATFNAFADLYIAPKMTDHQRMLHTSVIRNAAIVHWLSNTKPWEALSNIPVAWAMMPHRLYWNAAQRVLDHLSDGFVAALTENLQRYEELVHEEAVM